MFDQHLLQMITKRVIEKLKVYETYKVPVGISNRHVHLSPCDLEVLFGEGYQLTKKSGLKQPGQFASNETIVIRGPKGEFERVRILGPVRANSQIEISKTDSFRLGIRPPIRESGQIADTPGLTMIGPRGQVVLSQGAIIASRHIHMTSQQAKILGVCHREVVEVEIFGERRGLLGDVLVRVSDQSTLELHVDVDEANACSLNNNDHVMIHKNYQKGKDGLYAHL